MSKLPHPLPRPLPHPLTHPLAAARVPADAAEAVEMQWLRLALGRQGVDAAEDARRALRWI